MSYLNYIPRDGYTEKGFIAAEPGLFDAPLRFMFRPPLAEERAEHLEALDKLTSQVKAQLAYHAFIASRLCTWNHADDKGDMFPIDAVHVGRLKAALIGKLYAIVLGVTPSDLDPEESDKAKAEAVDAEYQSAKFGQNVADYKQEESEKN